MTLPVPSTHHRPRRKHSLEQTAHREEEGGGGQSLFVSGFAQKAWTNTAALEVMPENGRQIISEEKTMNTHFQKQSEVKCYTCIIAVSPGCKLDRCSFFTSMLFWIFSFEASESLYFSASLYSSNGLQLMLYSFREAKPFFKRGMGLLYRDMCRYVYLFLCSSSQSSRANVS